MSDFTPVVNLPVKTISGLNLELLSATTFKIIAGTCWDSTNVHSLTVSADITVDAAVNGVNGLDVGSLANATTYYIYVIGDASKHNLPKILASASATPVIPEGYDILRRIAFLRTDGSAEFWPVHQTGNGNLRNYFWDTTLNVITDGASTTYAGIDLSPAVPAVDDIIVGIRATFTPATAATNLGVMRTFGGVSTSTWDVNGTVDAVAQISHLPVLAKLDTGVPKIEYKVSNAGDKLSIDVMYFVDNL